MLDAGEAHPHPVDARTERASDIGGGMVGDGLVTALSAVWLLAGAGKLARPQTTRAFLAQLFGPQVTITGVRLAATAEVLISFAVATPGARPWAAVASTAGGTVLAAVLLRARLGRRNQAPCGCFGPLLSARTADMTQVALVTAMTAVSLLVALLDSPVAYVGLDAQLVAIAIAMAVTCTRYWRLRQAFFFGAPTEMEN